METWILVGLAALALVWMLSPKVPADAALAPDQLKDTLAREKSLQLIDVRTAGEYGSGRIAGSRNIPLGDLVGRLKELDPAKPVVVYCRSGQRSAVALRSLRSGGFPSAKHLSGGLMAWQGAGYPVAR